jgi:cation transport ATPase
MSRVPWARVAHAFRRVALPLASYYAVTLALPLANGAALSRAFMEHALVVLIVPPVAIILACAVHMACARTRMALEHAEQRDAVRGA